VHEPSIYLWKVSDPVYPFQLLEKNNLSPIKANDYVGMKTGNISLMELQAK
jgi:hypothetical protein